MTPFQKRHLSYEDRQYLEKLLKTEKNLSEVAKKIGMSRTNLYKERLRMGSLDVSYNASIAHQHCMNKRKNADIMRCATKHKISLSYRLYHLIKEIIERNADRGLDDLLSKCLLILEARSIR